MDATLTTFTTQMYTVGTRVIVWYTSTYVEPHFFCLVREALDYYGDYGLENWLTSFHSLRINISHVTNVYCM